MDPDVHARFQRVESNIDRLLNVVSGLVEVARSHDGRISGLADAMARLAEAQTHLSEAQAHLAEVQAQEQHRVSRLDEKLERLAEAQATTQEDLSVLIRMMDEWIKGNPRNGKNPQAGA